MVQSSNATRLMRIQARPGSPVEAPPLSLSRTRLGAAGPDAIARGIPPDASADLVFHGGKTVPQMEFQNIFLGGHASWLASDIDSINTAITLAMQDRRLNNVVRQYFDSGVNLTCDPRPLLVLEEAKPVQLDEPDVQQLVARLVQQGKVSDSDLGTTIFNLVLPPGTILKLDQDNSLGGLGGYHGSVDFQHNGRSQTAYYSANVFSQTLPNGRVNGIPAFDASWKDVVGTLYHEMNEFRTDADVGDAIATGNDDGVLGWMGAQGEIGDQPINAAGAAGAFVAGVSRDSEQHGGRARAGAVLVLERGPWRGGADRPTRPPGKKVTPDANSVLSDRGSASAGVGGHLCEPADTGRSLGKPWSPNPRPPIAPPPKAS